MAKTAFFGAIAVSFAVCAVSATAVASVVASSEDTSVGATQRRIHGIITAMDDQSVTITPFGERERSHRVTGGVDPDRTKILLDGRVAKQSELRLGHKAHGELGLDEIWAKLVVESK